MKKLMSVMFVGGLLLMSFGCEKENIESEEAEESFESLETPEDIEAHILRCEFGEDCMFI